mgnify:CR=1 FL=1
MTRILAITSALILAAGLAGCGKVGQLERPGPLFGQARNTTKKAAQAEYEKYKAQNAGLEYRARHILVEKEEDAKALIAQIKAGAKFEDLAKKKKIKTLGVSMGQVRPGTSFDPVPGEPGCLKPLLFEQHPEPAPDEELFEAAV